MIHNDWFKAGRKAYKLGFEFSDNPYNTKTGYQKYCGWMSGWMSGFQRSKAK